MQTENNENIKKWHRLEVFAEFLIFGILMGVIEDLIAIKFSTDSEITWRVIIIVTLVAIPFAAIGELIVDKKEFFMKAKRKITKEATGHMPHHHHK